MNKYLLSAILIGVMALTGCARHSKIIIDPKGIDMNQYHADLADCQRLADQVESHVAEGVVGGAVVGALFGAIVGGHKSARRTGAIGGLAGGLGAGGEEHRQHYQVLRKCLRNRGYEVLN